MADQMFTDEPIVVDEEPDLQSMFARLLWKEDWTDKVSNGLGRLFRHSDRDVEDDVLNENIEVEDPLPEELEALIPDMGEAKRAYNEMTSDYLDFIRQVWHAQQLRKKHQSQNSQ